MILGRRDRRRVRDLEAEVEGLHWCLRMESEAFCRVWEKLRQFEAHEAHHFDLAEDTTERDCAVESYPPGPISAAVKPSGWYEHSGGGVGYESGDDGDPS